MSGLNEIDHVNAIERAAAKYIERDNAPDDLKPFVAAVQRVKREIAAVRADKDLRPEGQHVLVFGLAAREGTPAVVGLAEKAIQHLDELAARGTVIADAITRLENEALAPRPVERTDDQRQLETFIWNRFATMNSTEQQRFYDAAVEKKDLALVDLLDRMPRAFDLRSDEARVKARTMRIDRSPQKPQINQLRCRMAARGHVSEMAVRFVNEMFDSIR